MVVKEREAGEAPTEFARPCVRRLRCRASLVRHEFAAHATGDWRQPCAQSTGELDGCSGPGRPRRFDSRELQPQGRIFDCDGLVAAQQESDESKDKQEEGWHVTPIVRPNSFQVNLLRTDTIMANDRV